MVRLGLALAVAAAAWLGAEADEAVAFETAECSSCAVIVAELLDAVGEEKPAMGVRVGMAKTVAYGVSDLRAATLLEELCPRMEDYRLMIDAVREAGAVVREVPYLQKLGSVGLDDLKRVVPPFVEVLAPEGLNVLARPFGEPSDAVLEGGHGLTRPELHAAGPLPRGATAPVLARRTTHAGTFFELGGGRGWVLDDDPKEPRETRKRRLAVHALKTDGGAKALRLKHRLRLKCEDLVEHREATLAAALRDGVSWTDAAAARDLALDVCAKPQIPSCVSAAEFDALPPHTADRYPRPAAAPRRKKKKKKKTTTTTTTKKPPPPRGGL